MVDGIVPFNRLDAISNEVRFLTSPICDGILPVIKLPCNSNVSKLVSNPTCDGMLPVNAVYDKTKNLRCVSDLKKFRLVPGLVSTNLWNKIYQDVSTWWDFLMTLAIFLEYPQNNSSLKLPEILDYWVSQFVLE